MPPLDNFLNAKTLIAPALAGAVVAWITNALSNNFGLPHAYVALAISLLVGIVLWQQDKSATGVLGLALLLLNWLIVFTLAVGSNTIGDAVTGGPPVAGVAPQLGFFRPWF